MLRDRQATLISNAMLRKQLWLMTPMEGTREAFISYIARNLTALLEGRWNDLVEHGSDPEEFREDRYGPLWLRLRVGTVGLLPLVVFLVSTHAFGLVIPDPMGIYVAAGALIWAVLSAMHVLDPSFGNRLSSFREVMSLARPADKK